MSCQGDVATMLLRRPGDQCCQLENLRRQPSASINRSTSSICAFRDRWRSRAISALSLRSKPSRLRRRLELAFSGHHPAVPLAGPLAFPPSPPGGAARASLAACARCRDSTMSSLDGDAVRRLDADLLVWADDDPRLRRFPWTGLPIGGLMPIGRRAGRAITGMSVVRQPHLGRSRGLVVIQSLRQPSVLPACTLGTIPGRHHHPASPGSEMLSMALPPTIMWRTARAKGPAGVARRAQSTCCANALHPGGDGDRPAARPVCSPAPCSPRTIFSLAGSWPPDDQRHSGARLSGRTGPPPSFTALPLRRRPIFLRSISAMPGFDPRIPLSMTTTRRQPAPGRAAWTKSASRLLAEPRRRGLGAGIVAVFLLLPVLAAAPRTLRPIRPGFSPTALQPPSVRPRVRHRPVRPRHPQPRHCTGPRASALFLDPSSPTGFGSGRRYSGSGLIRGGYYGKWVDFGDHAGRRRPASPFPICCLPSSSSAALGSGASSTR